MTSTATKTEPPPAVDQSKVYGPPAPAVSTIRLFTREPESQIPVHIEIVSATPAAALKNLESAMVWLKSKKYVPHEGFTNSKSGGRFTGKRSDGSGIACPICKGEMWDNRSKKASGEYKEGSSDFTCKKDGTHKFNMEDGKLAKHWSMTKNEQPEYNEEAPYDDLPFE